MKLFKSALFWQILIPVLLVVLIPMGTLLAVGWFTKQQATDLIAAGAPIEALQAALNAMMQFNLLIALLTLAAIIFVAYLLARRVIQALKDLQAAMISLQRDSFKDHELKETTKRKDELGELARIFQQTAEKVYDREERLRDEVTRLTIHIDTIQKKDAVEQIVSSDFFKTIEEKARLMRFRRTLAENAKDETPSD